MQPHPRTRPTSKINNSASPSVPIPTASSAPPICTARPQLTCLNASAYHVAHSHSLPATNTICAIARISGYNKLTIKTKRIENQLNFVDGVWFVAPTTKGTNLTKSTHDP